MGSTSTHSLTSSKAPHGRAWALSISVLPAPGSSLAQSLCPLESRTDRPPHGPVDKTHHFAEMVFAIATVLDVVHLQHFLLTQQACHLGAKRKSQPEKHVAADQSGPPSSHPPGLRLAGGQDRPRESLPSPPTRQLSMAELQGPTGGGSQGTLEGAGTGRGLTR